MIVIAFNALLLVIGLTVLLKGYDDFRTDPTTGENKCDEKNENSLTTGFYECKDYTKDTRFKIGASFSSLGFFFIIFLCWWPGEHTSHFPSVSHLFGINTVLPV